MRTGKDKSFIQKNTAKPKMDNIPGVQRVDLIALRHGLKAVAKAHYQTPIEFKRIKEVCEKQNLFVFPKYSRRRDRQETISGGFAIAYISQNEDIARDFAYNDPEFQSKPPLSQVRHFSQLLGYPDCCIEKYLDFECRGRDEEKKCAIFTREIQKQNKSYLLNNFLYGLGLSLSFYQPCSYQCKNAISYNQKILACVKQEDLNYAKQIENYLSFPLLVWFGITRRNTFDKFFHHRFQLLFNGRLEGYRIYYQDIVPYTMNMSPFRSLTNRYLKDFFLGNIISVSSTKVKIFSDAKFVQEIRTTRRHQGVLIKFD